MADSECIFSTIRLAKLSRLSFLDPTWDHAAALVWSTVESDVGALCACIPVMGPLLPKSWMGRSGSSKLPDGSGDSRTPGNKPLDYTRSNRTNESAAWHDDEHELVGAGDPMAIKQTTEFSVHEDSNPSATSNNKYAESRLDDWS